MVRITSSLATIVGLALARSAVATTPIKTETRTIAGASVHFVRVNLDTDAVLVQPVLPRGGIGTSESLASLASRGARVALTGAFFDTRNLIPMGDIVIAGRLVHFGGRGAALCLRRARGSEGWTASIRSNAGQDRHTDWGKSEIVLAGGIRLVSDSTVLVAPQEQGFSPLLEKPDPRVGVGITKSGNLIFAATKSPVSLTQWGRVLKSLGAVDALNYDGGSSTGLYVDGKAVITPGRKLTNALAVYIGSPQPSPPKAVALSSRKGKRRPRRT